MVLLVILITSFLSTNVFSDEETFSIFAVDCGDKAYLLDFKEMYSLESDIDFDLDGAEIQDYMDSYFSRMKKFDFGRTEVFKEIYLNLSTRTKFVNNINFGPISDNLGVVTWDGCEIKTVARATDPTIYESGFILFIDNSVFKKMDNKSKAGLYFNYLLNLDHVFARLSEHTEYSRYFNALIASNSFNNIPVSSYPYLYESVLDFNVVSFYGLFLKVNSYAYPEGRKYSIRYNDNGEISYAKISSDRFYFIDRPLFETVKIENAPNLKISHISYGEIKRTDKLRVNLKSSLKKGMSSCFGGFDFNGKFVEFGLIVKHSKLYVTSMRGEFKYKGLSFTEFNILNENISINKQSISERDFGSFGEIKPCKK